MPLEEEINNSGDYVVLKRTLSVFSLNLTYGGNLQMNTLKWAKFYLWTTPSLPMLAFGWTSVRFTRRKMRTVEEKNPIQHKAECVDSLRAFGQWVK